MVKQKWQQRVSFCILILSLFIPLTGYAASLLEAARDGDIKTVIDLLDKGTDVNEQGANGMTALMAAALNGRTEIVRLLLDRGAQADKQNNEGETLLMDIASRSSFTDKTGIAELLLGRGAQINKQDNFGNTALIKVVSVSTDDTDTSRIEMVKFLLKRGADIYINEALSATASFWNSEIAGLLIDKGADIDAAIAHLEKYTSSESGLEQFAATEGIRMLKEMKR